MNVDKKIVGRLRDVILGCLGLLLARLGVILARLGGAKTLQDGSKTPPRRFKTAPRRLQEGSKTEKAIKEQTKSSEIRRRLTKA